MERGRLPALQEAVELDTPIISLQDVSVRYRVPGKPRTGGTEQKRGWLNPRTREADFWALTDISVKVRRGEVYGIIGRNGSGKSTLLKVIARVLHPTRGRLVLRGQVAPLLELGAGFHPELTGRENAYFNSVLLGRTKKEVDALLPEIFGFAELAGFIDAPLRTYSTGMVARLGFAVATCVRPEILLVDEVLSVGDNRFQQKCLDRMYKFQEQGTTILIVSHSMATVENFCERALWLSEGKAAADGPVAEVIDQYATSLRGAGKLSPNGSTHTKRTTSRDVFTPLPEAGKIYPVGEALNILQGSLTVWVKFDSQRPFRDAVLFHTDDSRYVLYAGSYYSREHGRDVRVLVARAGGNQRAMDPLYGTSIYPEVSSMLDPEINPLGVAFPMDEWRLVTLTWDGYPAGRVSLYIDGKLVGERDYDSRHDRGSPLAYELATGFRPTSWPGEIVYKEDGTLADSRPDTDLSTSSSNIELHDIRLYQHALSRKEIQQIRLESAPL